jgi:hypothetical protein
MSFGTGAGKGDLPRAVNGEAYRDNYENIFRKKSPTFGELLKKHDEAIKEGQFDKAAEYKQQIDTLNANTIQ